MKTSINKQSVNQHKTALLIIDVQKGLFRKSTPIYQAEGLLRIINILVDRAHQAGAPVFYVQHSDNKTLKKGTDDWQLHPQLSPLDKDYIIPKSHVNAFKNSVLEKELKSKDIQCVVVTGLVTYACVRATCIGAKNLGYSVILVQNGHSNYSKHANQVIAGWNQRLSVDTVKLQSASEIEFA